MSLIDEALKRARQEAARQDAAAREERYKQVPVIPALRSRPRKSPLPLILSGVVAACLAVGIAIGVGLSRDDGELPEEARVAEAAPRTQVAHVEAEIPRVQPEPAPDLAPPVPEPPAAPVLEEVQEEPEPEAPVAPPVQETPPAPVPDPAERAARIAAQRAAQREIQLPPVPTESGIGIRPPQTPVEEPVSGPLAQAPLAVPVQPEPTPAAPAESGTVRTFQREMPVQGGTLRLNGIAYSEQPVALFDDKVVAPGESIAGYKVVAIEPKRVRLEGAGGVVVVELP